MKLFILLAVCTTLLGCASAVTAPAVVSYQLVLPPSELLKNCHLVTPPAVERYTTGTAAQKEAMLYDFSMASLTSLAKCNQQWAVLRGWMGQQKLIYPTSPGAAP
jgi:hypothetical protein